MLCLDMVSSSVLIPTRYINSFGLDPVLLSDRLFSSGDFATNAMAAAVDAAFLLLSTALDSKSLTQSLYYTIVNCLTLAS